MAETYPSVYGVQAGGGRAVVRGFSSHRARTYDSSTTLDTHKQL